MTNVVRCTCGVEIRDADEAREERGGVPAVHGRVHAPRAQGRARRPCAYLSGGPVAHPARGAPCRPRGRGRGGRFAVEPVGTAELKGIGPVDIWRLGSGPTR